MANVSPNTMRTSFVILIAAALLAFLACYVIGIAPAFSSRHYGKSAKDKCSTRSACIKAAEATNWSKIQSFVDTQIVGSREIMSAASELPSGTNVFDKRFTDAKLIADRVEKRMIRVNATPER